MNNKLLKALFLVHLLLGTGGYLMLNSLAIGVADGGAASAGPLLTILGVLVSYVLLQPVAFWLISWLGLAWWTLSGLVMLFVICLFNSLVVCGVMLFWRGSTPRRSSPKDS